MKNISILFIYKITSFYFICLFVMTSKEQTIWQTHKQLEEMLNKCIGLQWISNNGLLFMYIKKVWDQEWLIFKNSLDWSCLTMDYHRLFSKDSGIMEFVEWKPMYIEMKELYPWLTELQLHYCRMCDLTAIEKAQYFVKNAIIPQIKKSE